MWNILSKAFEQFRRWSAFKQLLELAGIWNWVALGACVVGGFLVAWFSRLDPAVRALVLLAAIAIALAITLFAVALARTIKQEAPGASVTSKPKKTHVAIAGLLVLLAVIGAVWGPNKPKPVGSSAPNIALPAPATADPIASLPPRLADSGTSQPKSAAKEGPLPPKEKLTKFNKGISVGTDSVAMGNIPDGSKIGDRSVVVGPTDNKGNTILNQGGLAVGNGAKADSSGIAIGAGATAGNANSAAPTPPSSQPPQVTNSAPFGIANSGTIGQATVNNFRSPQRTITPADRDLLVKTLSTMKASAHIFAPVSDNEAFTFAQELWDIFNDAQWTMVDGVRPVILAARMPAGVRVGFHSDDSSTITPDGQVDVDDRTLPGFTLKSLYLAHVKGLFVSRTPEITQGRLDILVTANPDALPSPK